MYRVAGDRRRIAKRNLELCFPEKSAAERKRLLKENFASTGIAFFEMAMSWWWSRERLAKLAHVEGLEHLQKAQREGKGVILMAVHFTTLEIGAALLGQQHTIDGMYREHKNPLFDYIQRRAASGTTSIRWRWSATTCAACSSCCVPAGRSGTHRIRTTAPSKASSCRCSAFRRRP